MGWVAFSQIRPNQKESQKESEFSERVWELSLFHHSDRIRNQSESGISENAGRGRGFIHLIGSDGVRRNQNKSENSGMAWEGSPCHSSDGVRSSQNAYFRKHLVLKGGDLLEMER